MSFFVMTGRARILGLVGVVAALAAACGDSAEDPSPTTAGPTSTSTSTGGSGGTGGEGGMAPTPCEQLAEAAQAALDQSLVEERADEPDRVGGTVAAILTPDCSWVGATGFSEVTSLVSGTPMEPDGIMPIASVTKTYTAAAVLLAAEDGLLALDDTLSTYVSTGLVHEDTITIRQLLNHSAGVSNFFEDQAFLMQIFAEPDVEVTPQGLVDVAIGLGPAFEPGTDFGYSNTHYVLLGMVLEAVSGQSFEAYVRSRVLEPHMSGRTFFATETLPEPVVTGYFRQDPALPIHPSIRYAAGDVVADVRDATTWIRDLATGNVLGDASKQAMQDFVPIGNSGFGYGLGLFRYAHPEFGVTIGHDGALSGYEAEIYALQDHDITVGIITNSRSSDDYGVWEAMARTALDATMAP